MSHTKTIRREQESVQNFLFIHLQFSSFDRLDAIRNSFFVYQHS